MECRGPTISTNFRPSCCSSLSSLNPEPPSSQYISTPIDPKHHSTLHLYQAILLDIHTKQGAPINPMTSMTNRTPQHERCLMRLHPCGLRRRWGLRSSCLSWLRYCRAAGYLLVSSHVPNTGIASYTSSRPQNDIGNYIGFCMTLRFQLYKDYLLWALKRHKEF